MHRIRSLIDHCSESDRRDIFAVACRVAFIDGSAHSEQHFLQQVARELGLTQSVAKRIEHLAGHDRDRRLPSIKKSVTQRLAFHFALAVASREQDVSLRKRDLLNQLAARLGRTPTETLELLTWYRGRELSDLVPPEAVPTRGILGPTLRPPISPEEWQRLVPAPRRIDFSVRGRVFLYGLSGPQLIAVFFGGFFILFGAIFALAVDGQLPFGLFFIGLGVLVLCCIATRLLSRMKRPLEILRFGRPVVQDDGRTLLSDPDRFSQAVSAEELCARLAVSDNGQWMLRDHPSSMGMFGPVMGMFGPVLKSLLIVTATYTLAVVGMYYGLGGPEKLTLDVNTNRDRDASLGMILMFTASHAVIPVFFYAVFLWSYREAPRRDVGAGGCTLRFIYLHMGLWFGVPIIGLAAKTGWLSLIWVVVHVALAQPGRRTFTFMEYGSTSVALFLFLTSYGKGTFFPEGLFIVIVQAAMLTIVDYFGEKVIVPSAVSDTPHSKQAKTPPRI